MSVLSALHYQYNTGRLVARMFGWPRFPPLVIATAIVIGSIVVPPTAVDADQWVIKNNCKQPIWAGYACSATGPTPSLTDNGGDGPIPPGSSITINVPPGSSSCRIWPRTNCKSTSSGQDCTTATTDCHCQTGDCGPNVQCSGKTGTPNTSLAEFTLADPSAGRSTDTYDVSYVDAYNVSIVMKPLQNFNSADGSTNKSCTACGQCNSDAKKIFPPQFQQQGLLYNGPSTPGTPGVISASGMCGVGGAQCCMTTDANGKSVPQSDGMKCQPNDLPPNIQSLYQQLKQDCSTAYFYNFDDVASTFTCTSNSYEIDFCGDQPGGDGSGKKRK